MADIWQIVSNGVALGDGTPFLWHENGPELFGWGSLRNNYQDRAGRHGFATGGPSYLGKSSKSLSLGFTILAGSSEEMQHRYTEFAEAFAPGDLELTLRTPERTFTAYGRADEVAIPPAPMLRFGNVANVAVKITLTDPLLYGPVGVYSIGLGGAPAPGGGHVFPYTFPFTFGGGGGGVAAGTATVTNTGNHPTGLGLLLYAASDVVAPVLAIYSTVHQLNFPLLTIPAGKWFVVDTAARTAAIALDPLDPAPQSVAHELDRPTSEWFLIPPGDSLIILVGGGSGSGILTVRPAWLR